MEFMRCRPVNVEASLEAAASVSAEDELIDSLGVCAAISTVSRYLPRNMSTQLQCTCKYAITIYANRTV